MDRSSTTPAVSIIICSANRAADLEATLLSFREVRLPAGWKCEIVIVDNASVDDTPKRAAQVQIPGCETRVVFEPRKGKGHAFNTGLAAARYDVIIATDDDVRPSANWIELMASPLLAEKCDAVVGRILLAPHLERPWLTEKLKAWIACVSKPPTDWPLELIGANMGFRRAVLDKVPGYDPDLGPGGLGLGDDTLFSWQIREAGFDIRFINDAVVVHHPHPSRLRCAAWLELARAHGRKDAYLQYHWKHQDIRLPFVRLFYTQLKLFLWGIVSRRSREDDEGCPGREMGYVGAIAMYRGFVKERTRPRNYASAGWLSKSIGVKESVMPTAKAGIFAKLIDKGRGEQAICFSDGRTWRTMNPR